MSAMPIAEPTSSSAALDLTWVRAQFPALAQTVNEPPMNVPRFFWMAREARKCRSA